MLFRSVQSSGKIDIAGNILSNTSSPLDVVLSSYESVLVETSASVGARNINVAAPTIEVDGSLLAYGSEGSGMPFMALLGSRIIIVGNLRAGSRPNSGSIQIEGEEEIELNDATIETEGDNGGSIAILSSNGFIKSQGSSILTNGENGRGGTISIIGSNDVLISGSLIQANGSLDGGLVIVSSTHKDVNFLQSFVQTNGGGGVGGTVLTSGFASTLLQSTEIDALGWIQGGTIKIGNDFSNLNLIPFSSFTSIDSYSVLKATQADSKNDLGGLIETSGHTLNMLASKIGRAHV